MTIDDIITSLSFRVYQFFAYFISTFISLSISQKNNNLMQV